MKKIFREWLYKFDAQMRAENRNILLFLDNLFGHSSNSFPNSLYYELSRRTNKSICPNQFVIERGDCINFLDFFKTHFLSGCF
jgi:hypothetical protein